MSERNTYHDHFSKSMGPIAVASYGGGYPRSVTIKSDHGELRVTYSEARDLHYVLDRMLTEIGEERP